MPGVATLPTLILTGGEIIRCSSGGYDYEITSAQLGLLAGSAIKTITAATYTMQPTDGCLIFNTAGGCVVTLLDPTQNPGRQIYTKNLSAFAIVSASANVIPLASITPGTAWIPATAGSAPMFISDGTNWVRMQ